MKNLAGLARLYPRPWRERYGAEFEALLEECPVSLPYVCDILIGGLDAWVHFGAGPRREAKMTRMAHLTGIARVGSMVIAAAMLDLSIAALSAFAWFDGNVPVAVWMSAAGIAATLAFATIAARLLHQTCGPRRLAS